MATLMQHWVAVLALIAYGAVLLYNGYIGRSRSSNIAEYYVGGRRLGGALLGVSFFATFASTNSYIGHAGKGYSYGAPWLIMVVLIVLFTYLSWRFVAPRMRAFTAAWGVVTVPDFIVARFAPANTPLTPAAARGRWLRIACALVILFSSLLYLLAVFKGAGNLLQSFLGVSYQGAVGITFAIVVLYTSVGGFHSVVRTDLVQGLLMLVGAVTIFVGVTQAAGGVGVVVAMAQEAPTAHLFEADAGIPFVVLFGIALAGSLKLLVDPRQISRFYGLRDERSVRRGLWIAVGGIAVIQMCLFPIGIYAHKILCCVQDTDLIVPTLVTDPAVFPLWVSDLLIVAILAAAMSSMDSVLLVAGSVLCNDLLAPVSKTVVRRPLAWTRGLVFAVALVGALLALNPPGGIVEMTILAGSLYAVCFLPALLLGLHWRRGDAQAVLWSMGLGVGTLILWRVSGANSVLHEVFPALTLSIVTFVWIARRRPSVLTQWPAVSSAVTSEAQ